MSLTQTPLPGSDALLIGLAALIVVVLRFLWPFAEHINAMAHEGTHAATGSVLGFQLNRVTLNLDATGATSFRKPIVGPRGIVAAFAGYVGPSAFGLGAAKLITLGHSVAVLWVAVVFLAVLALKLASRSFGLISVPAVIVLLYFLTRYTSLGLKVGMAYGLTWLLLLSGVRVALQDGANAVDAGVLRGITGLPRQLWALLWLAGTAGAVFEGGRMLIMRT
ncbi:MAG: M50 family metallopeptidase [Streptosporangiaceae bacterium]